MDVSIYCMDDPNHFVHVTVFQIINISLMYSLFMFCKQLVKERKILWEMSRRSAPVFPSLYAILLSSNNLIGNKIKDTEKRTTER